MMQAKTGGAFRCRAVHCINLQSLCYKNTGFLEEIRCFLTFREEMDAKKTGAELTVKSSKIECCETPTF